MKNSVKDNIFLMDTKARAAAYRCCCFEFFPAIHGIKEITKIKSDERVDDFR